MHYKTKESAVTKYGGMLTAGVPIEDIVAAIEADEKKFTAEDQKEIVAAILNPATAGGKTKDPVFNYRALVGDEFENYLKHFNSLVWTEKFDFQLFPAEGIFKTVHNENLDKVKKLVGIRLKDMTPKHTTRIPVAHARDLNNQIEQNTATNTGFYYLLKQE